ncbi:TIGR03364 family FAD-dependent oxidoreductase [Flavihumibacter rivuli]|uniref:TIGR03364 family FAD-dependent oxidoreductase n=1 Tax=Flavihumibacter rivuli TaxID=2838156 RepID=UPI001BDEF055|nr:TIGR03364 family FAD-dependent oxidoreductase [Flavihumibacter rivuli]ULQ57015.1 TIGR03364 family FAD-dependent oxidoreductase [Flavihumibacter rivuli]
MLNQHYDLMVIGAGVLGSFHAYHAARKGLNVLLLEKDHQPNEATVRNFGQVVPSGMPQGKWQEYGRRSMEIYREIQRSFDISIRENGTVYLASDNTELTLIEELTAINQQQHYHSTILSKEECLARFPGLRASYCMGGLFFPGEITIEPHLMIHQLIACLKEQYSITYKPLTLVQSIEQGSDHIKVRDNHGNTYKSKKAVICNGRDFRHLYPETFYSSDIEVSKLQMLSIAPMDGLDLPGSILSGLSIRRYESFTECPSYKKLDAANIPSSFRKWGIHLLFKQAIDGSIIIGDSHEYADARNSDELGFHCNQEITDIMLSEAQRMFAFPEWRVTRQWNGYYAQRKHHDVFLETVEPNVHIVTAIGGKGMTASAALAEEHIHQLFD